MKTSLNPEALCQEAQALFQSARFQETVELCNQLLEQFPNDGEGYFRRGLAYYYLDKLKVALADADRALTLNPEDARVYVLQALCKNFLNQTPAAKADSQKAMTLLAQGSLSTAEEYWIRGNAKRLLEDYRGALQDYEAALALNSNYVLAYNGRGNAKLELKDTRDAIADYDEAIRLNPEFASAYNNRGNAKYNLQDYPGAIADYDQAIRLNPEYADAYLNRGLAKYNLQDYPGAIADFDQAIRINPEYAKAYYNRGKAKSKLQDTHGAITDYDQAIRLNPEYALAYYNRGNAKRNLQDTRGAIADYDQAIRINPEYAKAYYNRGNAKRNLQDTRGAIADYDEAIRLNPEYAVAYNNRGTAKGNLQDYRGAIADFDQAIRLNPEYASAYNNRGTAKGNLQDYRGAIADYDEAIRINPEYADAYHNRGNAKDDLKDTRGAIADYAQALKLNSQLSPARQNLQALILSSPKTLSDFQQNALVRVALGQPQEALREINRAIQMNPQLPESYKIRAQIYEGLSQAGRVELDQARALYFKPLPSVESLREQGFERVWRGKYEKPEYTPHAPKSQGAFPGAIYLKAHTSPHPKTAPKTWMGKVGYDHVYAPTSGGIPMSAVRKGINRDAIKEKIAADCYQVLSMMWDSPFRLPKYRLAHLPLRNDYTRDNPDIARILREIQRSRPNLESAVHVMSKMVPGYQDLGRSQVLHEGRLMPLMTFFQQTRRIPESIQVENRSYRLAGLIELLAASRLLADVDVLGVQGTNAGFVLEGDLARVVKVDPGLSFCLTAGMNRFWDTLRPGENGPDRRMRFPLPDIKDLQLASNKEAPFISWQNLSALQQRQFLLMLNSGMRLFSDRTLLMYLIKRNGIFDEGAGEIFLKPEVIDHYIADLAEHVSQQQRAYAPELSKLAGTLRESDGGCVAF